MLPDQFDADRSALLVIDVQNDFFHEQGALAQRGASVLRGHRIVEPLLRLIIQCRELRVPVIFIKTEYSTWTDSPAWNSRKRRGGKVIKREAMLRAGSWGTDFYRVVPTDDDPVVVKNRYSAFFGTNLDTILRSKRVTAIVLAGTATDICIESTARDGISHDYWVLVLEDCTSTASDDAQTAALGRIERNFGFVGSSQDLIHLWRQGR